MTTESFRQQSLQIGRKISYPCFQSLHYRCRGNRTDKEQHKRTSCECLCHKDQIQIIPKAKLKTRTNIEMIEVKQIGKYDFDATNLKNGNKHIVMWDPHANTLGCTCMYGSQEVSSGEYDEMKRCKHVVATRKYLERKK